MEFLSGSFASAVRQSERTSSIATYLCTTLAIEMGTHESARNDLAEIGAIEIAETGIKQAIRKYPQITFDRICKKSLAAYISSGALNPEQGSDNALVRFNRRKRKFKTLHSVALNLISELLSCVENIVYVEDIILIRDSASFLMIENDKTEYCDLRIKKYCGEPINEEKIGLEPDLDICIAEKPGSRWLIEAMNAEAFFKSVSWGTVKGQIERLFGGAVYEKQHQIGILSDMIERYPGSLGFFIGYIERCISLLDSSNQFGISNQWDDFFGALEIESIMGEGPSLIDINKYEYDAGQLQGSEAADYLLGQVDIRGRDNYLELLDRYCKNVFAEEPMTNLNDRESALESLISMAFINNALMGYLDRCNELS